MFSNGGERCLENSCVSETFDPMSKSQKDRFPVLHSFLSLILFNTSQCRIFTQVISEDVCFPTVNDNEGCQVSDF